MPIHSIYCNFAFHAPWVPILMTRLLKTLII
jgi:hypothetical protein